MKKLINVNPSSVNTDAVLLLTRVAVAALMLSHGLPKLLMLLSGEPVQFPSVFGLSPELSLTLAVFSEVICSIFIFVGLGTRFAVIPLIITMLVAVLHIHAVDPFGKKELGLLYTIIYFTLLTAGSGRFSVDYILQKRMLKAGV